MNNVHLRLMQLKEKPIERNVEISFEFFPPKTEEQTKILKEALPEFTKFSPAHVAITYGAGGSTRERTYDLVKYIKENTSLNPAAHLTCVGASKDEVNKIASSYLDIGVNRIVALRGDLPSTEGVYTPYLDGYKYANELVEGLLEIGDFDISVAAYPEKHPEAKNIAKDIDNLKRKIDAGANRAITQYCFDTDHMLRFIDKVRRAGITVPIIPGIMLISNFKQSVNFSKRCEADVPKWMYDLFDTADENPELRYLVSALIAIEQSRILIQEGIEYLHFYTLNQFSLTSSVCHVIKSSLQE